MIREIIIVLLSIIGGMYLSNKWYQTVNSCHIPPINAADFFSTKSPYSPNPTLASSQTHSTHQDCSAKQIWMLVRHGTRNPNAEIITEMRKVLPSIRDKIVKAHENGSGILCDEEIKRLQSWAPLTTLKESEEKFLVPQGQIEMREIAQRFKLKFPQLFPSVYQNSTFKFKYTKTQRARESAVSFTESLFGDGHKDVWFPEPLDADPVLRFYKKCAKWKYAVDKNPASYIEQKTFESSEPFLESIERINSRIGLSSTPLAKSELILLYITCSFETAWSPPSLSPWCSVFSSQDLEVFEYHQDIEYYWIDGHGHEINYKCACPALKDILQHFDDLIKSPDESPNVVAYFTHSGTTLKFLASLGLYNDTLPLKSDNFHMQKERKWRTSLIDKFGSNFAFVLYSCKDSYYVKAFHQEAPIELEHCDKKINCSYEEFRKSLEMTIGECKFDEMCKYEKKTKDKLN